jgi:hypothetical protein
MGKLVKPTLVCACALLAAWVLASAWLHLSYCANLPSAPDERTGHTFRMIVNHGFVRYGTERQLHAFEAVEDASPIVGTVFVFAILIGVFSGQVPIRK